MDHAPYVIIGGGLAGVAAADTIRRRDKTGRLMLICAEPHPPYDRVPLSKGYLLGDIERDQIFLRPSRFYERNKVELVLGQAATALDLTDAADHAGRWSPDRLREAFTGYWRTPAPIAHSGG